MRVSVLNPAVDLIELCNTERPFTTMYLINFASWAQVDLKTLVHELTHVWQSSVEGPFYMVDALEAQFVGDGYAYTDDDLKAAAGDFNRFNPEQQASIIEDYWDRKYNHTPPEDTTDWQPYADVVHA